MVDPAGLVVLVAAIQLGQRHAQRLGDEQEGQEDAGGVQSRAPPAKRSRHGDGSMIRNTSISQQMSQSKNRSHSCNCVVAHLTFASWEQARLQDMVDHCGAAGLALHHSL